MVEERACIVRSDLVRLVYFMLGAVACDGVTADGVQELACSGCLVPVPVCRWRVGGGHDRLGG